MEQKVLSVLLIEDDRDYAQLVQRWLSAAGGDTAFSLSWADSLAGGLAELARGGVDVVVTDLGLPDSDGLGTCAAVLEQARARDLPLIILSSVDTESLALQTIQDGAENYLVKSACNAALLCRALRYAVAKHTVEVASRTRVIAVVGAKGGVGATTIACNLATEFRVQTGKRVLLADMDVNAGLVSFLMGVDSQYSIQYAIANFQRLDLSCWNSIVARDPNGLHIVSSPALQGSEEVQAETLRQVIALVQPFYDWMVLDLGRLNTLSVSLLCRVNEVLVVTSAGFAAAYEARRALEALAKAGMEGDRVRLIVNQADQAPALCRSDMRRVFGVEVYATTPKDAAELSQAMLARRPLSAKSALRVEIARMARRLAGLPEKKRRGPLSQLLSLPQRFRKPTGTGQVLPAG